MVVSGGLVVVQWWFCGSLVAVFFMVDLNGGGVWFSGSLVVVLWWIVVKWSFFMVRT